MLIPFLFLCTIILIMLVGSIRIIKEYQRAVVFRFGKFVGVRGPGLIWLNPIMDRVEIIDLNRRVPGWQKLRKTDLEDKVKSVAHANPRNIL